MIHIRRRSEKYSGATKVNRVGRAVDRLAGAAATFLVLTNSGLPPVAATSATRGSAVSRVPGVGSDSLLSPTLMDITPADTNPWSMAPIAAPFRASVTASVTRTSEPRPDRSRAFGAVSSLAVPCPHCHVWRPSTVDAMPGAPASGRTSRLPRPKPASRKRTRDSPGRLE